MVRLFDCLLNMHVYTHRSVTMLSTLSGELCFCNDSSCHTESKCWGKGSAGCSVLSRVSAPPPLRPWLGKHVRIQKQKEWKSQRVEKKEHCETLSSGRAMAAVPMDSLYAQPVTHMPVWMGVFMRCLSQTRSYSKLTAYGGRKVTISLGGVPTGRLSTLQRMAPQPCAQGQ